MLTLEFYKIGEDEMWLPYVEDGVSCGKPSPAYQQVIRRLSLQQELVKNPNSTLYARVCGQSMIDDGIADNDLLVVDRSLPPESGKIAVCFLDGEFTVKRLQIDSQGLWLIPANQAYSPILVTEENHFIIWGIVTHVIKSLA
ncbi:MAG: translesion error-prone DNA polymerase V autoproteolytic subunit [Weeksellaceae bacterium]|nr:translesion error-prone DNA polymerase V autoproteolytic subunit [Weeksellaceae bacterium]